MSSGGVTKAPWAGGASALSIANEVRQGHPAALAIEACQHPDRIGHSLDIREPHRPQDLPIVADEPPLLGTVRLDAATHARHLGPVHLELVVIEDPVAIGVPVGQQPALLSGRRPLVGLVLDLVLERPPEQVVGTRQFTDCDGRTLDVTELSPPDAGVFPRVDDRTTLVVDLRAATP